jgi:hypothetical protein
MGTATVGPQFMNSSNTLTGQHPSKKIKEAKGIHEFLTESGHLPR